MSVKISELPVLAPGDVAAGDAVAIVDASEGVTKQVDLSGVMSSGFRNAIINGNFAVNQRGASGAVTLSAGDYGHDRWKAGASGCTYTFATSANVTTLTIAAGSLVQVIEGASLFSGTYTLSFTGTAQGKIGAGSFGDSGITGSVTGGTNLNIEFGTGTVSQVQLEAGSVATPFERRPVGTELALCQRYYYSPTSAISLRIATTTASVQPLNSGFIAFPVTMRGAPVASVTFDDGLNIGTPSASITAEGVRFSCDSGGTGYATYIANFFSADAEL